MPIRKLAVTLASILLVMIIVLVTVIITHRPQGLWRIVASVSMPAPPESIAGGFVTLPPGTALPSEQACAARVTRSSWEPRPDNTTANQSVPTAQQIAHLAPFGPAIGVEAQADALRRQITGNFTGTTNEILQWVACKWGIDENILRAEAVVESNWHQSQRGDYTPNQSYCPPGTWDGAGCYQSYGILQIKWYYFQSTWPMSRDDTAFNAEYTYALIRSCYEGWMTYLADSPPVALSPRHFLEPQGKAPLLMMRPQG